MTPDIKRVPLGLKLVGGHRLRAVVVRDLLGRIALSVGAIVMRIAPHRMRHRLERGWARSVLRALKVEVTQDGASTLDIEQQYLIVGLHEGFIDIPVMLTLPLDLVFTVREELSKDTAIGRYVRASDQILVPDTRGLSDLRAMYESLESAAAIGRSIVVYPQGSVLGIEVAFAKGVAHLIRRLGLPVLPVVISGTHEVWEYPFSQTARLDQTVSMTVCEAIPAAEFDMARWSSLERGMKSIARAADVAPKHFVPIRDGYWLNYEYELDDTNPALVEDVSVRRTVEAARDRRRGQA